LGHSELPCAVVVSGLSDGGDVSREWNEENETVNVNFNLVKEKCVLALVRDLNIVFSCRCGLRIRRAGTR
jgi:hypothetical protein